MKVTFIENSDGTEMFTTREPHQEEYNNAVNVRVKEMSEEEFDTLMDDTKDKVYALSETKEKKKVKREKSLYWIKL